MYGHVVHALLRLVLDDLQDRVAVELACARAGGDFVDRHGADRDRGQPDELLAEKRKVAARAEVHDGVRAVFEGGLELFELVFRTAGGLGVSDIGIDLGTQGASDAHRL